VVAGHGNVQYRGPLDLRHSSTSELSAQTSADANSPAVDLSQPEVTQRMQTGRARLQFSVQIDCRPALHQRSGPASARQACLLRRDRSLRRRNAAKVDTTTAECLTSRLALVSTQEYRRNVGICLVNSEGLVFAARSERQGLLSQITVLLI